MPTIFNGISIALQTLLANQRAIQVVEHNVANANTPGYHRQEAVMSSNRAYPMPGLYGRSPVGGQIGSGVHVQLVRRYELTLYETPYRKELAANRYWASQQEPLLQAEGILSETSEAGLGAYLDQFWAHWTALSNDPSNRSIRMELVANAKALAMGFSHRASQLTAMRHSFDTALSGQVEQINQAAQQIATLNRQIAHVRASGDQPNDLLDERDRLIETLARLAGASAVEQETGDVMVSIGNHVLVFGTKYNQLEVRADPANDNLASIYWDDGSKLQLSQAGEIAGQLYVRDTILVDQLQRLNEAASYLITSVNALHTSGVDSYNNPGELFFLGADALSIRVNSVMDDPDRIAAGSEVDSPGDGSIALKIAQLKDSTYATAHGTYSVNGMITAQALALAMHIEASKASAKDHQLVLDSLSLQRESIVGVNLDEEAANLVKYQRTYQAAARLLTALDEMADQIINRMGRVGL